MPSSEGAKHDPRDPHSLTVVAQRRWLEPGHAGDPRGHFSADRSGFLQRATRVDHGGRQGWLGVGVQHQVVPRWGPGGAGGDLQSDEAEFRQVDAGSQPYLDVAWGCEARDADDEGRD